MKAPVIVWFRRDLRLADNPALTAAAASGHPVLPIYVDDGDAGAAGRWWLHHSLAALGRSLDAAGSQLVLRRGDPVQVLTDIVDETGATALHWSRRFEPRPAADDAELARRLRQRGIAVETHAANLLFEPVAIASRAGTPFRVFTAFWNACRERGAPGQPLAAPKRISAPQRFPKSQTLADLDLLPRNPDWSGGLAETWRPGESGARARLAQFLERGLMHYRAERDRPDREGTSRLSPHLHFGEIGPRQIWHATQMRATSIGCDGDAEAFLRQLGWREFSYHLLHHNPALPERNLRSDFDGFPWASNDALLRAWQRGRTGYPIVDAGMRQLWYTGWMHNRVRMIVGSFLVKHLLQRWQDGAAWFRDTLVDADLANNSASWQWIAGCGADAAPYFRIFNPVLQGARFDPDGAYVRRWVPELRRLPDAFIHCPWTAAPSLLAEHGVSLGNTYPHPIVEHATARKRALAAYEDAKRNAA